MPHVFVTVPWLALALLLVGPYRLSQQGQGALAGKVSQELRLTARQAGPVASQAACSPASPKQEEQGRCSSNNCGQPRVCSDEAKPESQLDNGWISDTYTGPRQTCNKAQTGSKAECLAPKQRGDRWLWQGLSAGRLQDQSWPWAHPAKPQGRSWQLQKNSSSLAAVNSGLITGELQLDEHKEIELLFLIRPLFYDLSKFIASFIMME